MNRIRKFLHWWLHHDPEGLERAKQADTQARVDLTEARLHGRRARRLLVENHLTDRFIADLRHGGHR